LLITASKTHQGLRSRWRPFTFRVTERVFVYPGRTPVHFADIRALDAELKALASEERRGLVHFLRSLDLLDRERAYADLNCASAFEYLVRELHMCEGTAWGRVNAMRLIRRFPQVATALEEGRLNPTQLKILGPLLTPENVDDLLRRATHLSKEKTKELAVALQPREVPAAGFRKLPTPPPTPAALLPVADPEPAQAPSPEKALTLSPALPPSAPEEHAPVPRPPSRSRIEPVAFEEWHWRIRVGRTRKEKLDRLRAYASNKVRPGDLDALFDMMLDDSLEKRGRMSGHLEPSRRRMAAPAKPPTPGKRAPVTLPVRREVLRRDGYRCTFVSETGERCPCTTRLEMDHIDPAKETGSSRAGDLTTRCHTHNLWRALRRYGREYVEKRIEEARRLRPVRAISGEGAGYGPSNQATTPVVIGSR
jgi:hypothetical protein